MPAESIETCKMAKELQVGDIVSDRKNNIYCKIRSIDKVTDKAISYTAEVMPPFKGVLTRRHSLNTIVLLKVDQ